jgi:hypothetical protein
VFREMRGGERYWTKRTVAGVVTRSTLCWRKRVS